MPPTRSTRGVSGSRRVSVFQLGGTSGVFIDNNGILVKDNTGATVIQLNNVASGGYYALIAGWGVGPQSLTNLNGSNNGVDIRVAGASAVNNGILIHTDSDGSFHSAIRVKVGGADKAVLGYLGNDGRRRVGRMGNRGRVRGIELHLARRYAFRGTAS